ncbi:HET-domain-containing protein [Parathielavia hyrcaniae]|uniref:HET-domain-containing protein n=1 Tax=Parathielavia hyrcaniae TaxID=113614 RepID=A0AAN6PTF0_9PEZI|nr:HET-domain-containing protein [Parathielavia hyrcaniae]
MAICSLCRSIPLPRLPELFWSSRELAPLDDIQRFYLDTTRSPADEVPGFPHHPNFDALSASAAGCNLCGLISESVCRFVDAYQKAHPARAPYLRDGDDPKDGLPLWLTRRLDGGEGFLVFVHSQSEACAYLVSGIGFCVEDDSPAGSIFCGRPVDEEPGTKRTLDQAVAWVEDCSETHAHCDRPEETLLPSRVLDLGCASRSDNVNLWEADGHRGYYAALSHCWGQSGHFTTTRASMEARKRGIRMDELPKTFRDAVVIARRLSICYLWIDSLCICQDDPEDWERESAKMAAVYRNAHLTIAANAAVNNAAGCFVRRPGRRHVPFDFVADNGKRIHLLAFGIPLEQAVSTERRVRMDKEPLSRRAWALQERMMARRILHCSTDQMYYECNEEFRSEDGFRAPGRANNGFPVGGWGSRHTEEHSRWSGTVGEYTRRQLTVATDKLPAISGMARMCAARIGAEYVAGLWSNALIEGLGWMGLGTQEGVHNNVPTLPRHYIAPSWSWASYTGIAAIELTGPDVSTVLDYHTSPAGSDPFGRLTDGWVRIRGPLIPLSIVDIPDDVSRPGRTSMRLRTPWGAPAGECPSFDDIYGCRPQVMSLVQSVQSLMPLFALVLSQSRVNADFYKALIVAADEGARPAMRRLGSMGLKRDMLGEAVDNPDTFTTLMLV